MRNEKAAISHIIFCCIKTYYGMTYERSVSLNKHVAVS